jgi:hypothetical protein
MTQGPRDKFYGCTIDEWISKVPGEFEVDAVGLWQIVSFGQEGFGLSGGALVEYVRRNLLTLMACGAKPIVGAVDGEHIWITIDYGETPEKICEPILAEWLASGRDPNEGDVWFAQPHIYNAIRASDAPDRRGSLSQLWLMSGIAVTSVDCTP